MHEDQIPCAIMEMINAYRVRGHLMADTDPPGKSAPPPRPTYRPTG
jgi:2-oxoglutarate dehydrogenase complex dehydrogenase (E1) component-like enzyme